MNMPPLTRRELLAGTGAAALARGANPRRPNILFIMVDEMRWSAMGCEGHPVVRTPNLDRLAREGTRFANAFTVSPVCCPARASVFSGRYAHVHGVVINELVAHRGEIFLPSILRHYGYHTAIAGKLHYQPKRFDFGFDEFWTYSNEGPHPELGYANYLKRKYGSPALFATMPGSCPWPDDPLGRDVGVFRYPQEDFQSEWITSRSLDYLRSRGGSGQPWFLFTSFLKPHSPSVEPKKYMEMYDPASLPVPKLPADIRQIRAAQPARFQRFYIDDERMLRVMTSAYYGAITHIDEQVGRILDELERLGMADNTLVLFTADHGNMLGDHGRWFKDVMYEGSTHVPLLWRGPRGARENGGQVQRRIVENIDLLPSILETAGLPVPEGVQGRGFLELLRGGDANWKDRCYSQLWTAMVRTPEWKFIDNSRDLSGSFELYRMSDDPKEEHDVADNPKYRGLVSDFKEQLKQWRSTRPAPVIIPGMPQPDYARVSEQERAGLWSKAPDNLMKVEMKVRVRSLKK